MDSNQKIKPVKRKYKALRLSTLFYFALKNLWSKKLRSFLTIFGVVIGISAIFFLLSFGLGIQKIVTTEVIGDKSLKALEVTSPNSKILKLGDEAVNSFRKYNHVEKVGLQYSFPGSLSIDGGEVDSIIYGINKEYQELTTLNLVRGRLLTEADTNAVVINRSALKTIGFEEDEEKAINQKVSIIVPFQKSEAEAKSINDEFTIVGVIDSGAGSEVFMPEHVFRSSGVQTYQQAKIAVNSTDNVPLVRQQVESNGFQTTSLTDTLTEINQIFKFFNLILISFGSIGMIVAILGMFNTLTISLLERTKEIGLMMALGGRRSDMRKIFVVEAGLISLLGAIVGVALAILAGVIVNLALNENAQRRGVVDGFNLFSWPLWAVGIVIFFTITIGLAVVYLPARRAEKINPIDALRRE